MSIEKYNSFPTDEDSIKELITEAETGNPHHQAKLSLMYMSGINIKQNLGKAVQLLELASREIWEVNRFYKAGRERNDSGAFYGLYLMWEFGWGVPVNIEIATKHLKQSAELGFSQAQFVLGLNFKCDYRGVEQNYLESEKWLLKSANQNNTGAYTALYHLYFEELKSSISYDLAFKYIKMAAENGWITDQLYCGKMYQNGYGVEQNNVEAFKWFYLAACQTIQAQYQIDEFLPNLNENEIQEGIELANSWIQNEQEKPDFTFERVPLKV
jgi:uncharacterized protein